MIGNQSNTSASRGEVPRMPWLLLLLGAFIYFAIQAIFLGIPAISDSSEAREAQVIDIIVRENTWILALRNGLIPSKPPLFHWIGAAIATVLGESSEFAARLPSQISASIILVLVGIIAYRMSLLTRTFQGARHPGRAAILASGILSLTYGFYRMGFQAMVDMTFAMCVWAAVACVACGNRALMRNERRLSSGARAGFWFFCALGVLARGPLGGALPIFMIGVAAVVGVGIPRAIQEFLRPSLGWLAFVLPVGWYYLAYQVGGEAFIERQIYFENIKRFSGGEFVNAQPWWFYVGTLARTTFPWCVVLIGAALAGLRTRHQISYASKPAALYWLPMIVFAAAVVLFSCSSGKRHSYMLPLLPLLAIQLGMELSTLLERGSDTYRARLLKVGRQVEAVLGVVGVLGLIFLALGYGTSILARLLPVSPGEAFDSVAERLGVLLVVVSMLVFGKTRKSLSALSASVWGIMLILQTGIVVAGIALKGDFKGFNAMSKQWLAVAGTQKQLAVFKDQYDESFDILLFYLRRPARLIPLDAHTSECQANTVYAAKASWLSAHEGEFPGRIVREALLKERFSSAQGNTSRDIVVFRCHRGLAEESFGHGLMHDAVFR